MKSARPYPSKGILVVRVWVSNLGCLICVATRVSGGLRGCRYGRFVPQPGMQQPPACYRDMLPASPVCEWPVHQPDMPHLALFSCLTICEPSRVLKKPFARLLQAPPSSTSRSRHGATSWSVRKTGTRYPPPDA